MSIAFEQVSFSYTPLTKRQKKAGEVQRYALRNVSFTLEDGEFLAIAGHTGSGKSTLVQHLNGLANPTEGRVLWNGEDLSDRKTATRARGDIGVVFQYPEHQLFAASVYEDVAFGPRNMGLSEEEVDARVREALEDAHLDFDALAERSPFELSGGMQQRVGIAAAMLLSPGVLLADEPTSALDVTLQKQVVEEMRMVRDTFGTAIVLVAHNLGVIGAMADNVLVLKDGKAVEYGKTGDVLANPQADYTRALLAAVPRLRR